MTIASTSLSPAEQDLSAIKVGEWGEREFPLGPRERPTRRQVIFKQTVLNDIYMHGHSASDIEVCGVLVGNVYHDAMGPFVFVEANIRGNFSSGKAAQVTFTAKTWAHIQDVMDRDYPDLRILGWYHTHPGHGIFLSDMDLFIHKNFFSLPWHLAFVFDPQNQEEGLFAWRTGSILIESFVVQKDAAPAAKVARRVPEFPTHATGLAASANSATGTTGSMHSGAAPALAPAPATAIATAPDVTRSEAAGAAPATVMRSHAIAAAIAGPRAVQNAEVTELALRIQTLEKRQRWYTVAMTLIVLVAVAWPVVFSAIAVLQAPDDPLAAPPISRSAAATAAGSEAFDEGAAMKAASVERDPEVGR